MRNELLFNNKKWSISDTTNKAIIDQQQWQESLKFNEENSRLSPGYNHHQKPKELLDARTELRNIIKQTHDYCCFVDGSWTSSTECACIGWLLYNNNAQFALRGMASINPMPTALEAEAEVLRTAMIHMKRLGYKKVTSTLFHNIKRIQKHWWEHSSISMYLQDILRLTQDYDQVTFSKIPRVVNFVADNLAKNARLNSIGLVISWNDVS
ncbi:unnamed protein product [Arabidopsis lyrata]|uniref:RNase H type-1 domain-containing protein n=1 Tax=Arabidopsis lyrata subsp. lyrata TaxID=81972 RepID=D7MTF2_ARALL|nr:hypothetical protein ARALYDRAFT_917546 [Arabidopsis lyrata subsp. lyrata]CAH8278705.1 unnamed protein product [Arabidopsis lyrata]